ncbi:MAG: inositol monophosphatase [Gammaproteobacteria bacterium]|nr:inositol monophosphatase [Gammaproteobacteria bacterium]
MLDSVANIVKRVAIEEICPRYQNVSHRLKSDGSYITDADLVMQKRISEELKKVWPQYAFLGEEMSKQQHEDLFKASDQGLWVLDPLDGTSNFAAGIPYFSVSLTFIKDGQLQMGVVYDPMREECFMAERGKGAFLNGQPIKNDPIEVPLRKSVAIVDYKRLPEVLLERMIKAPPFSSQRSFGSVALDWCWMACGRGHLYLHGRQKLWDYAAGYLIMLESGGHACTLSGEPVFVGTMEPRSAVASSDKRLFDEWREWLMENK